MLQNTEWILGLVVNTGNESKINFTSGKKVAAPGSNPRNPRLCCHGAAAEALLPRLVTRNAGVRLSAALSAG